MSLPQRAAGSGMQSEQLPDLDSLQELQRLGELTRKAMQPVEGRT